MQFKRLSDRMCLVCVLACGYAWCLQYSEATDISKLSAVRPLERDFVTQIIAPIGSGHKNGSQQQQQAFAVWLLGDKFADRDNVLYRLAAMSVVYCDDDPQVQRGIIRSEISDDEFPVCNTVSRSWLRSPTPRVIIAAIVEACDPDNRNVGQIYMVECRYYYENSKWRPLRMTVRVAGN